MDRRQAMQAVGLATVPLLLSTRGTRASAAAASGSPSIAEWRLGTLQYGSLSLRSSRFLVTFSANAIVREFAHLEIIEQTTAAVVITNDLNPPPAALTPRQQASLAALRAAPTDYNYVGLQINGHENLLHLQSELLQLQGLDQDVQDIARLLHSNVAQHLRLLKTIVLSAVGGAAASG